MPFTLLGVSGDDSAGTSDEEQTVGGGTIRTVNKASAQLVTFGKSWWSSTTDSQYLTSRASRRDLWAMLLPLTGLIAILLDAPGDMIIVLDACLSLAFVATTWLPAATLWSDAAIAAMSSAYMIGREIIAPGANSSVEYCRVVMVFSMAMAGVHSVAVGSFLLASTVSALVLQVDQSLEVLATCAYMLLLNIVVERRSAQLVVTAASASTRSGYKTLDFRGAAAFETHYQDASATRIHPPGQVDHIFHAASGSGSPSPLTGTSPTSSLADLWFTWKPSPKLRLPRQKPAQRFEAFEVSPPTAAEHLPPDFADDGRQADPEEGVSLLSKAGRGASSPGSARDEEPALRGVKLNGFILPALNVLYVERRGLTFAMNGRETYWSAANDFFIYYSKATDTWGVAKVKRFEQVKHGQSHGCAHSPEGDDICDKATGKGWREWQPQASQWVVRPNAGVESRGKVKPMTAQTPKADVAVQTDF